MQHSRRREVTYGKAVRNPVHDFTNSLQSPDRKPAQKLSSASHLLGNGRLPTPKRLFGTSSSADVFDVPSSDEDVPSVPVLKRPSRPLKNSPIPTRKHSLPQPSNIKRSLHTDPTSVSKPSTKRKRVDVVEPSSSLTGSRQIDSLIDFQAADGSTASLSSPSFSTIPSDSNTNHSAPGHVQELSSQTTPRPNQKRVTSQSASNEQLVDFRRPETPEAASQGPEEPLPQTPSTRTRSISASNQIKLSMTPKQNQLWNDLLGETDTSPVDSTSQQRLEALTINTARKAPNPTNLRVMLPRIKLIDALNGVHVDQFPDSDPVGGDSMSDGGGDIRQSAQKPEVDELLVVRDSQVDDPIRSSQSIPVTDAGPKYTYASQRSYLADPEMSFEASLQQPLYGVLDLPYQGSTSGLAGHDSCEYEGDQTGSNMKSIHELRAAGDNRRFHDEIEVALEDLASHAGISRKRSAMLDLVTKIADKEYATRFIEGEYELQVFANCDIEDDIIFGSASAMAVNLLLEYTTSARIAQNLQTVGILESASRMLKTTTDLTRIAKDRHTNMSKVARASVEEFCSLTKKSSIWQQDFEEIVSPRILGLTCLDGLARRLMTSGMIESPWTEEMLLELMKCFSAGFGSEQAITGLPADIEIKKLVLSVLESCTLVSKNSSSSVWTNELLTQLVKIITSSLDVPEDTRLRAFALRVLLNTTNNQEKDFEILTTSKLTHQLITCIVDDFDRISTDCGDDEYTAVLDELILSLGTMINLVEWSEATRKHVQDSHSGALRKLVKTFVESRKSAASADSMAETQLNVAYGYLAVLIANFCHNSQLRAAIVQALPNQRLDLVVEAIEEFTMFHKAAMAMSNNGGEESVWIGLSRRLQAVADWLRGIQ